MILILKLILITFVWVMGLTIITQKGMALYFIRERAESDGNKIYEPLILCEWCMPSIHSLVGYLFAFGIGEMDGYHWWYFIIIYPLVVMGASFTCGIVWTIYKTMDAIRLYYIKAEQLAHFEKWIE